MAERSEPAADEVPNSTAASEEEEAPPPPETPSATPLPEPEPLQLVVNNPAEAESKQPRFFAENGAQQRPSDLGGLGGSQSNLLASPGGTSLMTPGGTRIHSARDGEAEVQVEAQNAHAVNWERLLTLLETDGVKGLTSAEAAKRLAKFGKNKLAEKPPEPFWHKVFRQINNVLIYILIIAAIVAGIFEEWAEFGLILGVVFINMIIGLIQEGKAERATAALKAMLSSKATVIRDGTRMEIAAEEVVPGDLVFVESGNKIPADLRLINLSNLAIQESLLTGESVPVNKKTQRLPLKLGLGDRKNIAFSATSVIKGQGTGVVIATGDDTEIGKINRSVSEVKEEKTQLIKQVDAFGAFIGLMVIPIAVASFLLAYFSPSPNQRKVSYAFIEAVAISVAIIPEGLPAIITITLSLATANMAKHNAIVKSLPSVETLGSVMVICSDKTGTLTKNEMTTVACRTSSKLYNVTQVGYDPAGGKIEVDKENTASSPANAAADPFEADKTLQLFVEGGVLCNDAGIKADKIRGMDVVLPVGDPTEVALVTLAEKTGGRVKYDSLRKERPRIGVIPFESEHKFMCTFHKHKEDPNKVDIFIKGAPDRLVVRCSHDLDANGQPKPIDVGFWQEQAASLSEKGLRCLAVCHVVIDLTQMNDALAQGAAFVTAAPQPFITFLGLAAILDPPRQECKVAIAEARKAGVIVKMITGDHPGTAKAIGEQLGIVDEDHPLVLTGPELDVMPFEELRVNVLRCNVYARASPENKISIVRALQAEQKVSSMTGDGVNDAPALRAANIGVAMGITGTDVSKDAAKMILTDDNFATILVAVREGRRVWDNLKKLLVFNMPVAFAQGGVVFFALCLQWQRVPLTAIQILYVNMITACTLGLMLAVEPAEPDIMSRPPRSPTARLMGLFFYWRSCYVAVVFIVFVLGSVAWLNAISPKEVTIYTNNTLSDGTIVTTSENKTVHEADPEYQNAIALNTLVFCEITYAFNCRFLTSSSIHPRIFVGNPLAWVCAVVMITLQLMITYIPGLNSFFSMGKQMTAQMWGIAVLFAVVSFLIVEAEKAITPCVTPYTRPFFKRIQESCSCKIRCPRRVRRCGCRYINYEPHEAPKPQVKIPLKLKQGGSVRFHPDDLQARESV